MKVSLSFHRLYLCTLQAKHKIQTVYTIQYILYNALNISYNVICRIMLHLCLLYNEFLKKLQLTSQTFDPKQLNQVRVHQLAL
jgi:hypothetical protein